MALGVRFSFFIVRQGMLEARYPGGLEAFRAKFMQRTRSDVRRNRQIGADLHLIGFYSMGGYYQDALESLIVNGFSRSDADDSDIGYGDEIQGILGGKGWLEIGPGPSEPGFVICWLSGTEPGDMVEAYFA